MSIIFKALKKAEGPKSQPVGKSAAYGAKIGMKTGTVIAGIATLALLAAFVIYIKSSFFNKPEMTPSQTRVTATVQATPAKTAEEPKSASEGQIEKASAAMKDGNYERAKGMLAEALKAEPGNASAHNAMGLAFKHTNRPDEAETHYRQALKLRPRFPEAANNLAVLLESGERLKDADFYYKKALSQNPDYVDAHLNYAIMLEQNDRSAEARKHFDAVLRLSQDESLKDTVRRKFH